MWVTANRWLRSQAAVLCGLTLAGILLECGVAGGWLSALSLTGHPGFPGPHQDALIWLFGEGRAGIDGFLLCLGAVLLPYLLALGLAKRVTGRAAMLIAAGGAVIFGCTMLLTFPAGAIDIFHNVMDGRLFWVYHQNPLLVAPSAISHDPLYPYLHYWQSTTSTYGPLWYLLTGPAVLVGGTSLTRNIVAFKALPFAFELIALVLIVLIVRRIDRRQTVAALVCFGWNPLVLWEIAGNGHNDIVMMTFVLLAVLLLLTRWWPLAFAALGCSVLVKYISILLLPIFVLWIVQRYGRRALLPLANGLLAALVVTLIILLPLWSGWEIFSQLRDQPNDFIFSPASALIGNWGVDLPHSPGVQLVKYGLTVTFAVLYTLLLVRLRREPEGLIRACVAAMFLFLVLMTWWFWPWYVIWGLALAALLPRDVCSRLFVIFSATALLVYISSAWRLAIWNADNPFALAIGTALIVFLAPLAYAVLHLHAPDTES